MRPLTWRAREIGRISIISLATLGVFVSGKLWPRYENALWVAFLAAVGLFIYLDLRKPVNYKSIVVSRDTIQYTGIGGTDVIHLNQIARLLFVREQALFPDLYGPYIESKWMVQLLSGKHIEVMDEWPHRRLLLRTFEKYLLGFNSVAARTGFGAKKEGKWICYDLQANVADGRKQGA